MQRTVNSEGSVLRPLHTQCTRIALLVAASILLACTLSAQQAASKPLAKPVVKTPEARPAGMTNEDVVQLMKAGFTDDIVILKIQQAKDKSFDLSTQGMLVLKAASVTDRVIAVMLGAPDPGNVAKSAPAPAVATAEVTPTESPIVKEIGVYHMTDSGWADLLPEVVNWKTGGVLKRVASAGIIKGDINGRIMGVSSKTVLRKPFEILVYTDDGIAITEYQLLRLRRNGDSREFRTVTGGVLHSSGGATRDLVPFESDKVAPRTHKVFVPHLPPGDYGILPPGAAVASSASAQLGKIYTFRVE